MYDKIVTKLLYFCYLTIRFGIFQFIRYFFEQNERVKIKIIAIADIFETINSLSTTTDKNPLHSQLPKPELKLIYVST